MPLRLACGNWSELINEFGPTLVAHSQPNTEHKAVVRLEREGFPAYLPRYLKRYRRARRIEMVPAPLFPRYLFVAIDLAAQRWRSIFSTVGVSRIVCN